MIFQFGTITNPFTTLAPGTGPATSTSGSGLILILNNLVKFFIVIAALYTFWNLLAAGFMFLNAGGEAKQIAKAWDKIWQSLIGLTIVASSFVLAAIFGWLIFRDATILLQPRIFAP